MSGFALDSGNLGLFVKNVSLRVENLGIFVEKFSLFFKKVLKFYLFVIASVAKQSTTRQNRVFRLNLRFKNILACVCGLLRRVAPRNDAATPNLPKFRHFFKTMLIFSKKIPKFNLNPKISSIFAQKTHFVRSRLPRLDFVKARNDAATPNLPKFQHFFIKNSNPKISSIFTKKFIPNPHSKGIL